MSEIAIARINTFGTSPKADFVPHSEDSAFILTSSQLSALITQAIEKAIQPLQDEVLELKATVARIDRDNAAMQAMQETQADNSLIQLQLINQLREATKKEPGKITANQENRIKILRALLAAHNGKMLTKEARQIMRMDKGAFSRLVDAMQEYIETKPYSLNKRQTVLILKSRSIVDDNNQRSK